MTRHWPLGNGRKVTSPYGPRAGGHHSGTDFGRDGGSANMPVYAPASGTVMYCGAAQGYGGPDPAGWIVLDCGTETWELGHIVRLDHITKGTHVRAGQQIATINPNQVTNGGTAPHLHLSYMPGGYNPNNKQDPMPILAGATEPQGAENPLTAVKLDYDRSIVPQTTSWSCGPGAAEIVLDGLGIRVSERQLIQDIGTHTGGTDFVGLIEQRALNRYDPDGQWKSVYLEKDPCTPKQKKDLWDHLWHSIAVNRRGVVANFVVPPWNRPKSVPPSTIDLAYPNAWTWHYTAAMGVDDDPKMRKVWIADSGFKPGGAWISFDQFATLIPPKGYAWASAPAATKPPAPPKPEQPPSKQPLDIVLHEVTQRLPGRSFDDELRDLIIDPYRPDTVLGHSINSASLGRINFELLQRIARHLDIPIDDIR